MRCNISVARVASDCLENSDVGDDAKDGAAETTGTVPAMDAFAVNVPATESLLDAFTVADIKKALGKKSSAIHVYNGSDPWYEDVLANRKGSQLGWHLLVALFILLTVIASLFRGRDALRINSSKQSPLSLMRLLRDWGPGNDY